MSHYRKKAYKKKHIDAFHQKEMIDAVKNEIDIYLEDPFEDTESIKMEEPLGITDEIKKDKELDIVTILKIEEKQGLLPMWMLKKKYKTKENLESEEITQMKIKPKSYSEALNIAKKFMKQIYD